MKFWRSVVLAGLSLVAACGDGKTDVKKTDAAADETATVSDPIRPLAGLSLEEAQTRAAAGEAAAQYELGLRTVTGDGVAKSPPEGVHLFSAAAEQGYPQAQMEMGIAYLTGEGKRPNIKEATRWFRLASNNNADAAEFAKQLEGARDGTEDVPLNKAMWLFADDEVDAAFEIFAPLAEEGKTIAAYYAGYILAGRTTYSDSAQITTNDNADEAQAMAYHQKAAEDSFLWSALDLADIHRIRIARAADSAERQAEADEARRWYEKARTLGYDPFVELDFVTNDLAAAEERGGAVPASSPDGRSDLQICGRIWGQWNWRTADILGVLTFDDDGRVAAAPNEAAPPAITGTWLCHPASASFVITWQNGVVETITMAADGQSVSGSNSLGLPVSGTPLR
jgi:TPR repeat protein